MHMFGKCCCYVHLQVDLWLGKQAVQVSLHYLAPNPKLLGQKDVMLTRAYTPAEAIVALKQQEAKVPKPPVLHAKLLEGALKKRGLVQDSEDGQATPKRAKLDAKTKHLLT